MCWYEIIIVVLGILGFSIITNALFLKFSRTLGLRTAKEDGIRWESNQKPSFGGITMYIIFLLSVVVYSIISYDDHLARNLEFLGFLLAVSLGFITGLFDDAFNTKPIIKLLLQIMTAFIIILSNTYIQISGCVFIDYAITVFWVVGIMNAINLLDNMDAIASSVVVYILFCFLVIMNLNGFDDGPFVFISLGLVSAIFGFLFFNWHPSKLFMGDTGSMFLGATVAFLGIKYGWNLQLNGFYIDSWTKIIIVAIIFIVPITDTTTVFFKRLLAKKSPFVGGKDHTSHHLYYLGLSQRKVALVYALIGILTVLSVLKIISIIGNWNSFITIGCVTFIIIVFGGLFYISNINKDKE